MKQSELKRLKPGIALRIKKRFRSLCKHSIVWVLEYPYNENPGMIKVHDGDIVYVWGVDVVSPSGVKNEQERPRED